MGCISQAESPAVLYCGLGGYLAWGRSLWWQMGFGAAKIRVNHWAKGYHIYVIYIYIYTYIYIYMYISMYIYIYISMYIYIYVIYIFTPYTWLLKFIVRNMMRTHCFWATWWWNCRMGWRPWSCTRANQSMQVWSYFPFISLHCTCNMYMYIL